VDAAQAGLLTQALEFVGVPLMADGGAVLAYRDYVVEQAKGFLREILDISVEDAYGLLRRYAQVHGDQQVRVSRRLMSGPGARTAILAAMRQMLAGPCC
jgi:hypothetical protein